MGWDGAAAMAVGMVAWVTESVRVARKQLIFRNSDHESLAVSHLPSPAYAHANIRFLSCVGSDGEINRAPVLDTADLIGWSISYNA